MAQCGEQRHHSRSSLSLPPSPVEPRGAQSNTFILSFLPGGRAQRCQQRHHSDGGSTPRGGAGLPAAPGAVGRVVRQGQDTHLLIPPLFPHPQVGGRSVVNSDITQTVEVRPEGEQRFLRLLELLGEWCDKGKILVFVHSQDKCDALFRDLLKSGYPCLSLHGAKDQTDRESTLQDFKTNVCNLLVATSVAARGLDVKELELVINYDVPNHYEDYVHRVGRTGRAGRKGCAVTFISPEEDRFAPDLVRALELSKQPIPEDLKAMADAFTAKVKAGSVVAHGSGYGGSGFKFNEEEEAAKKALKKAQAKEYGVVVDEEEGGEEEEEKEEKDGSGAIRRVEAPSAGGAAASAAQSIAAAVAAAAAAAAANKAGGAVPAVAGAAAANPIQAAVQARMAQMGITPAAGTAGAAGAAGAAAALANPLAASLVGAAAAGESAATAIATAAAAAPTPVSRAAAFAAAISLQHNLAKLQPAEPVKAHYEAEFEINEFPQHARWKITHKETLNQIIEWTGSSVTTRGLYCPPGKALAAGEKKLYLSIEGPTEASVKKAKVEIKRIIEEASAADASHQQRPVQPGRGGTRLCDAWAGAVLCQVTAAVCAEGIGGMRNCGGMGDCGGLLGDGCGGERWLICTSGGRCRLVLSSEVRADGMKSGSCDLS
ncbi:unnamed protein product [Closterium sp. NIES-53]